MIKSKVTIGLPVFNGEKYIEGALNSALSQSFANFKIVIADNASSDNSEMICRQFAEKDPRVVYIRHTENMGPANNFKFLQGQADGEYFIWLACDDRWAPDFLNDAVALLDSDPDCHLVFCDYIVRNLESGHESINHVCSSNSNNPFLRCLIRLLDVCPSMIYGLYRVSTLREVSLKNFDFADVHFVMEFAIKGRIKIINYPCYIAGVKGSRIAYSLTGKKISRLPFLKTEIAMFFRHLRILPATILSTLAILIMIKSKLSLVEKNDYY